LRKSFHDGSRRHTTADNANLEVVVVLLAARFEILDFRRWDCGVVVLVTRHVLFAPFTFDVNR